MAQPAMVAALQAGAVRGIMYGSPFWEPAVTGGFGLILLDGPSGEFPAENAPASTTALITTGERGTSDGAQVKAIQVALGEPAGLIGTDPAQACRRLHTQQQAISAAPGHTIPFDIGANRRRALPLDVEPVITACEGSHAGPIEEARTSGGSAWVGALICGGCWRVRISS